MEVVGADAAVAVEIEVEGRDPAAPWAMFSDSVA